jgi:hypothetical protein
MWEVHNSCTSLNRLSTDREIEQSRLRQNSVFTAQPSCRLATWIICILPSHHITHTLRTVCSGSGAGHQHHHIGRCQQLVIVVQSMPPTHKKKHPTARASARVVPLRVPESPIEYIYDEDTGELVPQPGPRSLDPVSAADAQQGANLDDIGPGGDDHPWPDQGVFMEEHMEDDVDDDTWVHNAFKNARNESGSVRALQVTEAGEVLMMAPVYNVATRQVGTEAGRVDLSQQAARICPFAIVRVQQVHFDAGPQFFSVCQNPGCDRCNDDDDLTRDFACLPHRQHLRLQDVLGERKPPCRCARAAIKAVWGTVGNPGDIANDSSFYVWFVS